jgi:hypothetical protein
VQQLRGFDILRNNQVIIRNRSAKVDITVVSFYLSASYFSFRFLPLAKIIKLVERAYPSFFMAVQMEVKEVKIAFWTSAMCRNNSTSFQLDVVTR